MYIYIYIMIDFQMLAWAFFSFKGGAVTNKQFYLFTIGMLIGQAGTSVETFLSQTWGTFIVQIYFFAFTLIGGIKRYRLAKLKTVK